MSIFDKLKSFSRLIFFSLILVEGISYFSPAFAAYNYVFSLENETNLTLELSNANGNYYQHNMGTSVKFAIGFGRGEQLKDLGTLYIPTGKFMLNVADADSNDTGASSVDFNVLNKAIGKIIAIFGIAQPHTLSYFKLKRHYVIDQYKIMYNSHNIPANYQTTIAVIIRPNPKYEK